MYDYFARILVHTIFVQSCSLCDAFKISQHIRPLSICHRRYTICYVRHYYCNIRNKCVTEQFFLEKHVPRHTKCLFGRERSQARSRRRRSTDSREPTSSSGSFPLRLQTDRSARLASSWRTWEEGGQSIQTMMCRPVGLCAVRLCRTKTDTSYWIDKPRCLLHAQRARCILLQL